MGTLYSISLPLSETSGYSGIPVFDFLETYIQKTVGGFTMHYSLKCYWKNWNDRLYWEQKEYKSFFVALIYLGNNKAEQTQQENLHLLNWIRCVWSESRHREDGCSFLD